MFGRDESRPTSDRRSVRKVHEENVSSIVDSSARGSRESFSALEVIFKSTHRPPIPLVDRTLASLWDRHDANIFLRSMVELSSADVRTQLSFSPHPSFFFSPLTVIAETEVRWTGILPVSDADSLRIPFETWPTRRDARDHHGELSSQGQIQTESAAPLFRRAHLFHARRIVSASAEWRR